VDLEKAFDRVPKSKKVSYWSLRKKGISKKLVRVIKSMSDGAITTVRSGQGNTEAFEIYMSRCTQRILSQSTAIYYGRYQGIC